MLAQIFTVEPDIGAVADGEEVHPQVTVMPLPGEVDIAPKPGISVAERGSLAEVDTIDRAEIWCVA